MYKYNDTMIVGVVQLSSMGQRNGSASNLYLGVYCTSPVLPISGVSYPLTAQSKPKSSRVEPIFCSSQRKTGRMNYGTHSSHCIPTN